MMKRVNILDIIEEKSKNKNRLGEELRHMMYGVDREEGQEFSWLDALEDVVMFADDVGDSYLYRLCVLLYLKIGWLEEGDFSKIQIFSTSGGRRKKGEKINGKEYVWKHTYGFRPENNMINCKENN